ncbi:MAG: N-6 DNA methylase [Actinomycetota bacterium]|nr:N-6 DNA methylase [Actinomycetota bacterium]
MFLLVAEDRDLFHPPGTSDEARRRYARYYSLGRTRDQARCHRGGRHVDLFASLRPVFDALGGEGLPAIGVPALGSFLWSPDACPDLDGAALSNSDLLDAVRHLAYTEHDHTLQRVDFANLGPEELGSVYESLLELHPRLELDAARFELVSVAGSERKSTGSYYTPTALISALLDQALDPLLDEAEAAPDPTAAILAIKVLDPACGSGHFLTAAARRIATRLAAAETGELNPTPEAVRHALRQVVGRCIYGIDLNPMAIELAKVNLWLDAVEPGLPLRFLDHHLVCGNGLVGATPRLIAQGIPDQAFKPIEGDDKPTATARKKTNSAERRQRNQGLLALGDSALAVADQLAKAVQVLDAVDDSTPDALRAKQQYWEELQSSPDVRLAKLVADTWCAAFFAPKIPDQPAITDQTLRAVAADRTDNPDAIRLVAQLSERYRFLHPHLAFPDVFAADSEADHGWQGGFDLVLGNPPWDTLSPDRKEFFSAYESQIRFVPKAGQDAIVSELLEDPEIAARWNDYQRDLYASVHFMKASGRYRLFAPGNLGKGDFNVYRMFVETGLGLTRSGGYAAQIVPAGFYGGANAAAIRLEVFAHWQLDYLLGFINASTDPWFPGVHKGDTRFAMYIARQGSGTKEFRAAFALRTRSELFRVLDGETTVLSVEDVREQSPKAFAIPEVTNAEDAALAARMSGSWLPFGDEMAGPPARNYQRELDMGTDRELFGDYPDGLPVYEGRMVDQFDHRAKAYRSGRGRSAVWEPLDFGDPRKAISPQWRLPPDRIPSKLGDRIWRYRVGWCDVAQPETERSLLAALIPPGTICGHKVPTLAFPDGFEWAYMLWLAVANSIPLDFLARKKISLTMSMTIIDSLPFPRLSIGHPATQRIAPLALRLTCTAPEMTGYWNSMARRGWCERIPEDSTPPGFVDPEQRAAARAEIDAVVARQLFELSSSELATILDTFPVLRRREEKTYGEFRTKRLVLEWYDKL